MAFWKGQSSSTAASLFLFLKRGGLFGYLFIDVPIWRLAIPVALISYVRTLSSTHCYFSFGVCFGWCVRDDLLWHLRDPLDLVPSSIKRAAVSGYYPYPLLHWMQTVANQATGNQSRLFPGENASDPSRDVQAAAHDGCLNRHRLEAVKLNLTSSLCNFGGHQKWVGGWTGFESSGRAICRLRHYPRISSQHQIKMSDPFQGSEQGSLNLIRQAWVYK